MGGRVDEGAVERVGARVGAAQVHAAERPLGLLRRRAAVVSALDYDPNTSTPPSSSSHQYKQLLAVASSEEGGSRGVRPKPTALSERQMRPEAASLRRYHRSTARPRGRSARLIVRLPKGSSYTRESGTLR